MTYSVVLPRLAPEAIETFILAELDRCGLGHNTSSPTRSSSAPARDSYAGRKPLLGTLIEAVRDQTRTVDLTQVNPPGAHPAAFEERLRRRVVAFSEDR